MRAFTAYMVGLAIGLVIVLIANVIHYFYF